MNRTTFRRAVLAVVLLVSMLCQGTWALAGTTGGLSGTVTDAQSNAPIAGANVTVSSPSQTATGTTDSTGHFAFLSLAPDTYTIAVEHAGYEPITVPGNPVFADTVQRVGVRMATQLKTIATVRSQGAGSLVRSGTTADVYAVNAAQQQAVAAVGGGGGLNSAYSAIATVPGAYVAGNQGGYYQTVHIRGGDFDQVGYEFDGVPINRSFDNYPSGAASSLGQQEVQVYTGAAPSNSESQGLAGFINQVIKTGTSPGFADGQLGVGAPYFYHHALGEAGGATPNRLFSYYVGLGGLNQTNTYVDSTNASVYNNWLGIPIAANPDGTWQLAGSEYGLPASLSTRDVVANFHIGIPHHKDGGRDDIQLLYDGESINNGFYQSPFQAVGTDTTSSFGQAFYLDGYNWNCPDGQVFTAGNLPASSCLSAYLYPNHTQNRLANVPGTPTSCPTIPCSFIPLNTRDTSWNDQQIVKVQYQKNFGSAAYLRLYGYTYYSDWLLDGPTSTYDNLPGTGYGPAAPDYELTSHTRGVSLNFSDQLNQQNLISVQGSYTSAKSTRDNNTQMFNGLLGSYVMLMAVNAADPYSGYCYSSAGGTPVSCAPGGPSANVSLRSFGKFAADPGANPLPALPATCVDPNVASTTCAYMTTENGLRATYNTVTPEFTAYSFTDQFRPSERWLFNFGVRWDNYKFVGSDVTHGAARQFWYNGYNKSTCVQTSTGVPFDVNDPVVVAAGGTGAVGTCPAGFTQANLSNDIGRPVEQFMIFQPRLAFTYTLSPDTVLRGSVGKYAQPPNSAFEQYDMLQDNIPYGLLGPNFLQYGRTSPSFAINPPTSTNADLSLEHHFHNSDVSVKLTPFYRHTQNQIQNFYLNQATGFISGLNVGAQSSRGFELQIQKGDFSRNGFAVLTAFAYTYSTIKYGALSNGTTIITPLNSTIANYNAYTSACAPGGALAGKSQFGQSLCGSTASGVAAAPCYTAAGAPDAACGPGDYGNPYWKAPGQGLIDPGQAFPTYDIFPAGIGSSASAFGAPYTSTLVLNYKHDRWSITPSFQFQGGTRYGAPLTEPGINPDSACGILAPGTNSNYPYGNPGPNAYDASGCTAGLVIPDPFTKTFDNLGSFVQPNQFMMNAQVSYDVSPRVTITAAFANIVNRCWGGTKAAWTVSDPNICSYGIVANGLIPPAGNVFNPGSPAALQPFRQFPYQGAFGPFDINGLNTTSKQPFNMYFEARVKI